MILTLTFTSLFELYKLEITREGFDLIRFQLSLSSAVDQLLRKKKKEIVIFLINPEMVPRATSVKWYYLWAFYVANHLRDALWHEVRCIVSSEVSKGFLNRSARRTMKHKISQMNVLSKMHIRWYTLNSEEREITFFESAHDYDGSMRDTL